jgi:hypothetical protein
MLLCDGAIAIARSYALSRDLRIPLSFSLVIVLLVEKMIV